MTTKSTANDQNRFPTSSDASISDASIPWQNDSVTSPTATQRNTEQQAETTAPLKAPLNTSGNAHFPKRQTTEQLKDSTEHKIPSKRSDDRPLSEGIELPEQSIRQTASLNGHFSAIKNKSKPTQSHTEQHLSEVPSSLSSNISKNFTKSAPLHNTEQTTSKTTTLSSLNSFNFPKNKPLSSPSKTSEQNNSPFSKFSLKKRRDALTAILLFLLTFTALFAGEKSVGFVRDEGIYFESGRRYAAWYTEDIPKLGMDAFKDKAIKARFETNREHPALMKSLFGLSHRLFTQTFRLVRPATGFRLPAIFLSALFSALIFIFGRDMVSRRGAVFATLAFWLIPRTFFHGVLSCFDVPIAFAWLLTVAAYRQALIQKTWKWSILTGLAFGFALSVKHNAWIIPGVLIIHWLLAVAPTFRNKVCGFPLWKNVLKSLSPFFAMATIGPLVLYATWPFLWHHPAKRFLWYANFHNAHINYPWEYFGKVLFDGPFPPGYALGLTVLTVPTALLILMATGALREMIRFAITYVFTPLRRRFSSTQEDLPLEVQQAVQETIQAIDRDDSDSGLELTAAVPSESEKKLCQDESEKNSNANDVEKNAFGFPPLDSDSLLLLGNGFALLFVFSMPFIPIFGGAKHWIGAMPFLCIFAARSLERISTYLAASIDKATSNFLKSQRFFKNFSYRSSTFVFAILAFFTLLPGFIGLIRVHPYGTTFYSELAGGIPGAASLGMHRQYWSNNVTGVLPWINDNAPKNARIYLHEVTGFAFKDYQKNGMLRPDFRPVFSPHNADAVAYQFMPEFRDAEFVIWNTFKTMNPDFGLYVDETPQVMVFLRQKQ